VPKGRYWYGPGFWKRGRNWVPGSGGLEEALIGMANPQLTGPTGGGPVIGLMPVMRPIRHGWQSRILKDEAHFLKEQAEVIKAELAEIEKRLAELEQEQKTTRWR